ncbi:2-methylcitrate synthase [Marinomonas sp. M1K-6]|uniref:Citrate synthase n=1 Tax=Marinomonas profundi TaxID=2726122 RepID=A0A847QUY4_9GAMM|nr:2-methylcitrate synthase [Marinomonas profundi]NLQ16458.1 2-methylcitrate synthase [Marinomonas profundi]UDV03952.1 2-methylcitrate synthase [Marinomonas profundi]
MAKVLSGAGLRGQSAGETALCTVGKAASGLTYRGYDIDLLADKASFEEVAYLLLYGALPNRAQLTAYQDKLIGLRSLPETLKKALELIPADAHPMDVMRTGCSFLGNLEPELDAEEEHRTANRLIATLPAIVLYWYRFSHDGVRVDTLNAQVPSLAGHFLTMLHDKEPSALHTQVMNASLILYAEHEFNASTFTARVCASTLSDMYSCVTGGIGSLRGPLHGGANEAAMEMIEPWQSPDEAEAALLQKLANKEKVMGFGHAIYSERDPRNDIIKKWAKKLSEDVGDDHLYAVSERCEAVMWREKKLFCNADFFHASAYRFMGIPTKLFTPIFVCSRVTGWAAHVMEQRANNRIIRPSADYIGPDHSEWVDIDDRH